MSTKLALIAADFSTQLAAKMLVGATTGTLQSVTDDDGVALANGTYYFTIDGNNSSKEYLQVVITGTAMSSVKSVTRQGVISSGTVREHRAGALVELTDFAVLKFLVSLFTGVDDLNASTPLEYDGVATLTPGSNQLATVVYADAIAAAGAADASLTGKGLVEIATTAEIDAGTGTGGTGAIVAVSPDQLAASIYATRLPSADQKAAMAGGSTFGTPSTSNKFITQDYNSSATGLPVVRVYTANANNGDSTTQIDITNPTGTTFRYTFDGTGTDPGFSLAAFPIGSVVDIQAQNFSAGNKGLFVTTGAGANYIEVTNASGVVESNKTIGTGYIVKGGTWTKPAGLKYIKIKLVGAGSAGDGTTSSDATCDGGSSGGYAEKLIATAALAATVSYSVGYRTAGTTADATAVAGRTIFNHSSAIIGTGGTGNDTPGAGSGGDINIAGMRGGGNINNPSAGNLSGCGGSTLLGIGGVGVSGASGNAAAGYGAGGGGGDASGSGDVSGGDGTSGIIIIEEYYS